MKYELTQDQVNFIIALLNEAPYKLSAPIIQTLVDQFRKATADPVPNPE